MRLTFLLASFILAASLDANAQLLTDPSSRWAVLASRDKLDEVIGVASAYRWRFDDVRVVRSSNGWLAIIAGPIPIPNGIKAARQALLDQGGVPTDLFFSNGGEFETTLWQPDEVAFPTSEASASNPAEFAHADLDILVDTVPASYEMQSPRITAVKNGEEIFSSVLGGVETADGASTVTSVPLDPSSAAEEIVFSGYWGGAHCCTVTQLFSEVDGQWQKTEGATLDGEGYWFQDLDGDGSMELISVDNSFLYAFSDYASSRPPRVVEQLRDGKIVDMRHSPAFATFYRRELYRIEHLAELDAMWNFNGFLAGWVATKALLGEFDEAWQKMMASYDKANGWDMQICVRPLDLAGCPEGSKRDATFPEALRQLLEVRGYIEADRSKAGLPGSAGLQ